MSPGYEFSTIFFVFFPSESGREGGETNQAIGHGVGRRRRVLKKREARFSFFFICCFFLCFGSLAFLLISFHLPFGSSFLLSRDL